MIVEHTYGLWSLVIINSLVFIIFAFSFFSGLLACAIVSILHEAQRRHRDRRGAVLTPMSIHESGSGVLSPPVAA
jgi:hypothetical protein